MVQHKTPQEHMRIAESHLDSDLTSSLLKAITHALLAIAGQLEPTVTETRREEPLRFVEPPEITPLPSNQKRTLEIDYNAVSDFEANQHFATCSVCGNLTDARRHILQARGKAGGAD